MRLIRVFPRRTSMTPTDDMAFSGDPPLFRPEADEVHISVAFTWDKAEGERLRDAWAQYYPVVKIGGPAYGDIGSEFVPGRYVKEGIVFTSRGCIRHCPWCLVPTHEGKLRTLPIADGWIVQDNNLLATPREHQEQVYEMLRRQKKRVTLSGGLDVRLIDDWVVDQLRSLRIDQVFLAADTEAIMPIFREAIARLDFLTRDQLRCFVLIGRDKTIQQAQRRLVEVWNAGALPAPQLYQPDDKFIRYNQEWRSLMRSWARPAAVKSMMQSV